MFEGSSLKSKNTLNQMPATTRMKKLYRNPATWVALVLFTAMTYLFFQKFPLVASILYGSLILYIVARQIRSVLRLRRQGYRFRGAGRERFLYEELADGEIRHLVVYGTFMPKGKMGIYWPTREVWQQQAPDWAKNRRDEIFDRIRKELGNRFSQCIETDRVG